MRSIALVLLFFAAPLYGSTKVTLLHFSDYHSHALPFYTEDGQRGGIARAIGYLKSEKRNGALVFSGGDTINKGAPAWSDKYGCAEWPWLNGIVDAMAFGNHEADYGRAAFERCVAASRYPIISANVSGFRPYQVFEKNGIRIGVFAVAGSDFGKLGVAKNLAWNPSEEALPRFGDPIEAARTVVRTLRETERVDVVVMIGHQHAAADEQMARAVAGIDLIFGSHSHLARELSRIDGTGTWFISPFQYLTWVSRVELTVENGRVTAARGGLVPVDSSMPEDWRVARRVRRMQRDLERDPTYRELFLTVGKLPAPLSVEALAMKSLEAVRAATGADLALSTSSSFRGALPSGTLTMELLRGALPYDNEIVVCEMTGPQLSRVLAESEARKATDSASFVSGHASIDGARVYLVATTDYQAFVSYKDVFDCEKKRTGLRVRDELRKALTSSGSD